MAELYHVLSRGVDKRKIFMDNKDYFRFIHDLFEFNDEAPAVNTFRKMNDIVSRYNRHKRKSRELLVDVLAFCLMPNHYHLFLKSRGEGGVSKFMRKLNVGYAKYFNQKYKRTGTLFEGRYKSIRIASQAHFIYLPYYIHLNPLDLFAPEWRERKLKDYKKSLNFLSSYRWSSHLDYLGKKNFPSLTSRDFLFEIFGGERGYEKKLSRWLKDLELVKIRGIALE
ncbi:MAG: transposase [Candidatus Portnoybacteria bacterium]|jgi:putative transposase|nr:transposase [Candidatus Portnoybacteria bacterium]